MNTPDNPKIYHIVHVDRLASIVSKEFHFCDACVQEDSSLSGTKRGMSNIKSRRLYELKLHTHQDLYVGQCVPFYFCPRSVMLYVIRCRDHPGLSYRGGQAPIIHLKADLRATVEWANQHGQRWAFTSGNAGSYYFEDFCQLSDLNKLDWKAIGARDWVELMEGKQAEFLIEQRFPWSLVESIGVYSEFVLKEVQHILSKSTHCPQVSIEPQWYY